MLEIIKKLVIYNGFNHNIYSSREIKIMNVSFYIIDKLNYIYAFLLQHQLIFV